MRRLSLLAAALLAACAAPREDTLQRLPPPPPPPSPAAAPDRDAAIAAYRAYLADADPRAPGYDQALERLAQLELARGEARAAGPAPSPPGDGAAAGDTRAAIARLGELIRRHPRDPRLPWWLYQLGRAQQQEGNRRAALAAFTRLAEAHPAHELAPEARFRSAEILFAQGRYAEAEAAYARVLAGPEAGFQAVARYKHAWALLKTGQAKAALDEFLRLYRLQGLDQDRPPALNDAARARRDDLLRGIHLALDHLGGPAALARVDEAGLAHPERLYDSLARHYLERERYLDAAEAALAYGRRHARDPRAAALALTALEAQRRGGLLRAARELEARLARDYTDPEQWAEAPPDLRATVLPAYLRLLERRARRAHARAQARHGEGEAAPARHEAIWAYRRWLALAPPEHPQRPRYAFLLGEILEADGQAAAAATVFTDLARRHPEHPRAAPAAYAALLIHTRALRRADETARPDALARWRAAARAFLADFPDHPQAARVRAEWILVRLQAGEDAEREARALLAAQAGALPAVYPALLHAWLGDRAYARGDFPGAAQDYQAALAALGRIPAGRTADGLAPPDGARLQRRLAASHHHAAERLAEAGDLDQALIHYRAAARAPAPELAAAARRDALARLMAAGRWHQALAWLQELPPPAGDERAARHALVLERLGRLEAAAARYRRLAETAADPQLAREARLSSARLYARAGRRREAVAQYKAYVYRHRPAPERAQEARWALADLYQALEEPDKRRFWLRRLAEAAEAPGATDGVRLLGARAALVLADEAAARYRALRLRPPLDRRLRDKRRRLQAALDAYARAARLEAAEVVTAATYQSAELYRDLARALLQAPLPEGLDAEEQAAYRLQVEELAYPLEERAIALHQANAARAREGLYDRWVGASYRALAELVPARYAKLETVEAFDERLP